MHSFLAFARAPLAWGLLIVALYAPFVVIAPVFAPPPATCTDVLWCDSAAVGLVFDPNPRPEDLYALIAISNAFIAFFAAHVAGYGTSPRKHRFMAGPVLALIGATLFAFTPFSLGWLWTDRSASYAPALWAMGLQYGLMMGILLGLPAAVLTLLGALVWRRTRRAPARAM